MDVGIYLIDAYSLTNGLQSTIMNKTTRYCFIVLALFVNEKHVSIVAFLTNYYANKNLMTCHAFSTLIIIIIS